MENKKGYTDAPSSKDLLKRGDYVQALKKIVTTCDTPMTISITGEWGSGKTSFVHQLKGQLDKEKIEFVEFNTWEISQFEPNDNLKLSLLKSYVSEIAPDKKTAKLLKRVIRAGANVFLSTALNKFPKLDFSNLDLEKLMKGESIHGESSIVQDVKELKKSIEDQISSKNKRYVIFIDDLDRINPENAIEILEFLKLFLSMEHCVYLVAVDEKVIEEGLKAKYKNTDSDSRNYFEKLIQLPFYLPNTLSNDEQIREYIGNLGEFNNVRGIDLNLVSKIVNSSVGGNPRRIKRIMNAYWLLRTMMDGKEVNKKVKPKLLFYIVCFQTHYNSQYSEFEASINQNATIKETITGLKEDNGDNAEFLDFISILEKDFSKGLSVEVLKSIMSFSQVNRTEIGNAGNLTEDMRELIPILFDSTEKMTRQELWSELKEEFPTLKEKPGAFNGLLHRVDKGKAILNGEGKVLVRDRSEKEPTYHFVDPTTR
ncbi:P-loop NTPase fold protein [Enterococcus pseudoavium]|uniref:KAP family P-loop NTPase fold protein n=1 Tax=Enterococcus pseudoavium TaxID=44007 RepID=UPI00288E2C6A|nr:P-loop NTPase fold protein [Enterococcus pseudoavium]MDT2754656.1 P-loop NTPase fold protein [Enterococcus pseudoavium]